MQKNNVSNLVLKIDSLKQVSLKGMFDQFAKISVKKVTFLEPKKSTISQDDSTFYGSGNRGEDRGHLFGDVAHGNPNEVPKGTEKSTHFLGMLEMSIIEVLNASDLVLTVLSFCLLNWMYLNIYIYLYLYCIYNSIEVAYHRSHPKGFNQRDFLRSLWWCINGPSQTLWVVFDTWIIMFSWWL